MKSDMPAGWWRRRRGTALGLVLAIAFGATAGAATGLTPEVEKALGGAEYVYIASTRKDGSLSEKAEIWFMYDRGKVYVGTPPTSWRVKRIRWGRPKAKIWVGSQGGPSFEATGALVKDPALYERMYEVYAKKYPEGWKRHEDGFRKGFQDGSRVMVEYSPPDGSPSGAVLEPRLRRLGIYRGRYAQRQRCGHRPGGSDSSFPPHGSVLPTAISADPAPGQVRPRQVSAEPDWRARRPVSGGARRR